MTHATPAALYAHIQNRDWEADTLMPAEFRNDCDDIAKQLIYSNVGKKVNVVFGGGRENFLTESEGGKQKHDHQILVRQVSAVGALLQILSK